MAHSASENPPASIRVWLSVQATRRFLVANPAPVLARLNDDDDEDEDEDETVPEKARSESSSERAPQGLVCVGCKAHAPGTHTAHTLIGSKHGWRVMRRPGVIGRAAFEWRCPRCWAAFKAQRVREQAR